MKLCRKGRTDHYSYICMGGPWGGRKVFLPTLTIVFKLQGYCGRYRDGRWEDVL